MNFFIAYFTLVFTNWFSFFIYNLYALIFAGTVFCWLSLLRDKLNKPARYTMSAISFFISHLITGLCLALEIVNGVSSVLCLRIYCVFILAALGTYLIVSHRVEKRLGGANAV